MLPYSPVSFLFLVSALAATVHGQNFSIPPGWRKPTSDRSRTERLSIAQIAITSLIPMMNASDGTTTPFMDIWSCADVVAGLAQHDYITGTQDNHDFVSNTIAGFQRTHDPSYFDRDHPLQDVTSDALMWGLAAFYGYRAYNDSNLLDRALDVWSVGQAYSVTTQDGLSGTQPTRNVSFPVNCVSNVTSAGAVFWHVADPTDLGCNAETVGAFVALSAHLWESTGNMTYLNAAELSASFMYTHMYSSSAKVVIDTYQLGACDVDTGLWTYNQGFLLEGLAILSLAPVSDNATWTTLLHTLVDSTVQQSIWTTPNGDNAGVITENDSSDPTQFQERWIFRNAFIRALYEVWSRTSPPSPVADLIQAFMMVQYNALLDLASNNGDFYSPLWSGPTLKTSVPWGQTSALQVLNAAISMPPTNGTSSSTMTSALPTATSSPATASARAHKTLAVDAIAGIVVGATVGVAVLVLMVFLRVKRNRRRRVMMEQVGPPDTSEDVDPFPPGLPVTQERQNLFSTGYTNKSRSDYGQGHPGFSTSPATAVEVNRPASASAYRPAVFDPAESPFGDLTRMVREMRTPLYDPPPSYYTGSE